jgi:hypothetical protein
LREHGYHFQAAATKEGRSEATPGSQAKKWSGIESFFQKYGQSSVLSKPTAENESLKFCGFYITTGF